MSRKAYAIILIAFSCVGWYFPGFNGFFFEDAIVTDGEGRIMASILFVGGLILWYLPSKE